MNQLDQVLSALDDGREDALARLKTLLAMQSISTDPEYAGEVATTGDHLVADLASMGFEAQAHATQGHPMVVATSTKAHAEGPHILFYGHYDVQPVDPLELWDSDPFEAQIVEEDGEPTIVARGASDDKGQVMTFIEACRAWISTTGALPGPVTILLEGEEESGSPSLEPFLKEKGHLLKSDMAFICDTNMWNADTPALTVSLRGLMGEEVTIQAADKDLHSGLFGGPARNPIHVLASILSELRDDQGHITLPGFYDGVPELAEETREQWQGLGFDEQAFLGSVGLSEPAGEAGHSVLEQIWSRPTLEVNGITGGYTGTGFKTVLPGQASAKISCRLVGDQDPAAIRRSLRSFIAERLPADCEAVFHDHGEGNGLILPVDHPMVAQTRLALKQEWDRECATIGSGGSIPIVAAFKAHLGLDSVMVGFALENDRIHSPNEKYNLKSFQKGARSWARILEALASQA